VFDLGRYLERIAAVATASSRGCWPRALRSTASHWRPTGVWSW